MKWIRNKILSRISFLFVFSLLSFALLRRIQVRNELAICSMWRLCCIRSVHCIVQHQCIRVVRWCSPNACAPVYWICSLSYVATYIDVRSTDADYTLLNEFAAFVNKTAVSFTHSITINCTWRALYQIAVRKTNLIMCTRKSAKWWSCFANALVIYTMHLNNCQHLRIMLLVLASGVFVCALLCWSFMLTMAVWLLSCVCHKPMSRIII